MLYVLIITYLCSPKQCDADHPPEIRIYDMKLDDCRQFRDVHRIGATAVCVDQKTYREVR